MVDTTTTGILIQNLWVNYLSSMAEANIEFVELGLRSFPKDDFLGAFAYTTEEFLNTIHLPDGPTYGVMVDAKTILDSGMSVGEGYRCAFHSRIAEQNTPCTHCCSLQ